jgi:hypothetical protein
VKAQEGWREGKMNRIRENSSAMASKTRMQVQLLSMICKGREEEAKDQSVRRGKWRGRGGRTISTSNLSSSERKIASSNCQREGESERSERWEKDGSGRDESTDLILSHLFEREGFFRANGDADPLGGARKTLVSSGQEAQGETSSFRRLLSGWPRRPEQSLFG